MLRLTVFTRKRVLTFSLIGFALFVISGGFDLSVAFLTGWRNLETPVITSLSPIAFMFYFFGFVGVWLLWHGGTILQTDEKLGKKQVEAGLLMLYIVLLLFEILIRFGFLVI